MGMGLVGLEFTVFWSLQKMDDFDGSRRTRGAMDLVIDLGLPTGIVSIFTINKLNHTVHGPYCFNEQQNIIQWHYV